MWINKLRPIPAAIILVCLAIFGAFLIAVCETTGFISDCFDKGIIDVLKLGDKVSAWGKK